MYGCTAINNVQIELAIVHSREKTMSSCTRTILESLVEGLGFPSDFQLNINQTEGELQYQDALTADYLDPDTDDSFNTIFRLPLESE